MEQRKIFVCHQKSPLHKHFVCLNNTRKNFDLPLQKILLSYTSIFQGTNPHACYFSRWQRLLFGGKLPKTTRRSIDNYIEERSCCKLLLLNIQYHRQDCN